MGSHGSEYIPHLKAINFIYYRLFQQIPDYDVCRQPVNRIIFVKSTAHQKR